MNDSIIFFIELSFQNILIFVCIEYNRWKFEWSRRKWYHFFFYSTEYAENTCQSDLSWYMYFPFLEKKSSSRDILEFFREKNTIWYVDYFSFGICDLGVVECDFFYHSLHIVRSCTTSDEISDLEHMRHHDRHRPDEIREHITRTEEKECSSDSGSSQKTRNIDIQIFRKIEKSDEPHSYE